MLSYTQHRRIEWGDCDPAGIVFNPRFFQFFDHGSAMLFEAAGWPKPVLVKTFDIMGIPVVETRAKFLRPCTYGEDVTIVTGILETRRSSFDIGHRLMRGETLCVEGFETRVWTVRNAETGEIRSAPLPDIVLERLHA